MRARLPEVSSLRNSNLDTTAIDEILNQRQRWRATMQGRWFKDTDAGFKREITQVMRTNLHDFARFLSTIDDPYKIVISMSNMWIYTNHPDLFSRLDSLPYLQSKSFAQAMIDRPVDTILMLHPRHHYRCYFRSIKVTAQEKQRLTDFIKNYDGIRVSPALNQWLENSKYQRTMEYYFVDHSDPGWEVLLSLVKPGIIRKTMQIMAK